MAVLAGVANDLSFCPVSVTTWAGYQWAVLVQSRLQMGVKGEHLSDKGFCSPLSFGWGWLDDSNAGRHVFIRSFGAGHAFP